MVIDSIQTVYTDQLQSAPGAVAQVRESAAQLVRFAKQTGVALFLVGHVTKEGTLAGPRVLEHMVDTVLYFEGDSGGRYRIIRAVKNRFGASSEMGVFAMTDKGLREVSNPSAIFLSRHAEQVSGSCILVTREGTRPLLVEVQALVDQSPLANPRRVALGLDQNRLSMLLAVMHRHGGIALFDQDALQRGTGTAMDGPPPVTGARASAPDQAWEIAHHVEGAGLYVAQDAPFLGVVQVFTPDGEFHYVVGEVDEPTVFETPVGLAAAGGKLYFTNALEGIIFSADADGANPIEIVPVTSTIGAEIRGVSLAHAGGGVSEPGSGERLAVRNLMDELRGAGLAGRGGPAPYSDRDKQAFANALDRLLARL